MRGKRLLYLLLLTILIVLYKTKNIENIRRINVKNRELRSHFKFQELNGRKTNITFSEIIYSLIIIILASIKID